MVQKFTFKNFKKILKFQKNTRNFQNEILKIPEQ